MRLFAPVRLQWNTETKEDQVLQFAKEELTRYLQIIFAGEAAGSGTVLSVAFWLESREELQFDGYEVRLTECGLCIISREARGILYGVYEFLRMLGCRFLFPLAQLETIPVLRQTELPDGITRKNPWLEFRGQALYQATGSTVEVTIAMIDWMTKNNFNLLLTSLHRTDDSGTDANAMLWDEIGPMLLPHLRRRGTVIDMSEHSTDSFFPRDELFAKHPEWFALRDGKRVKGQICYANLDAVAVYADSFVRFVKDNHDFDIIGLWPLDGGGYCQCEHCKDKHAILNANREVARRIGEVRPDLIVEYLAYTPQSWEPPADDLPQNISVLVCDIHDKIGYSWGVRAQNAGGAFFFDYMTADNFRYRANVWLNPSYCHDMVNTFIRYHYRGVISLFLPISNWWQSCINANYLAQLYYNPLLSVDAWTAQLSEDLFGAGNSELAQAIFRRIFTDLQDRGLWGRVPHALGPYHARVTDRCEKADTAHRAYLADVIAGLTAMLDALYDRELTPPQALQAQCLKEYVQLQWLFFKGVDQYNADAPDKEAIEEYLAALRACQAKPLRGFISEQFARFRIFGTGDVLFDA